MLISKLKKIFEINLEENDEELKVDEKLHVQALIWQECVNIEKGFFHLTYNDWHIDYVSTKNLILIKNKFHQISFWVSWSGIDEDNYLNGYVELNPPKLGTSEYRRHMTSPNCRIMILTYDHKNNIHFHLRTRNRKNSLKYLDVVLKDNIKIKDQSVKLAFENLIRVSNDLGILRKEFFHRYDVPFSGISQITKNKLYNILNDSQYWKYQLNLKGLLLYLYIEAIVIKKLEVFENTGRKKGEKRIPLASKRKKRMVEKLIDCKKIEKLCPFLMFYDDFKEIGFDSIEALLDISIELTPRIEYYELNIYKLYKGPGVIQYGETLNPDGTMKLNLDGYILWKVWERYYFEVEKFFITKYHNENETLFHIKNRNKIAIYEKLSEFRLQTSLILQKMVRLEKNSLINIYNKAYEDFWRKKVPFLKDFPLPDEFNENLHL